MAVLDDDSSLVELYQNILEDEGYGVKPVLLTKNIPSIMGQLRCFEAGLLVLDIHMPGIDVFNLLQQILTEPQLQGLKILLCSASKISLTNLLESLEEAGLPQQATLEKPFDLEDLIDCVKTLIGPPLNCTSIFS